MKHVKKMILVPHDTVARLHDTPTATPQTQMSSLDTTMTQIMRQQYADDSEKWKKYNEALQRYLHFAGETRKPLTLELSTEQSSSSAVREQLYSVMPKKYKEQAVKIYDYLANSPLTWDTTGAVSVDGTLIPQSNIIDLISDLTRSRKHFIPHGSTQFIQALGRINIPLDLIGNEHHRTAILKAKQTGGGITIGNPVRGVKKPGSRRPEKKIPIRKIPVRKSRKNVWKNYLP
jgi:hypothetical protein